MSKPRGAGDLRQRVKFQRRSQVDDGYGNERADWADMAPPVERSCSLAPTRGGESVQASRLSGQASWDLWVRSDSGTRTVATSDRVVDLRGGQTFNIIFGPADMDGRGVWLLMQLESGLADG